MERIDKQIVASGLGLLSVAGLGTGLAHADTVQQAVNQAVVSLSGQGKVIQTSVTTTAPLKIATGKIVRRHRQRHKLSSPQNQRFIAYNMAIHSGTSPKRMMLVWQNWWRIIKVLT